MRAANMNLVAILALVAGCIGGDDADDNIVGGGGKDDGIAEFRLSLTSSGGVLRARETPRLPGSVSGSTASFTCPVDDRKPTGWRLLCERGKERLSIAYGSAERAGAAVYQKSASEPDRRSYYRCTATTQPADAWPQELRCTAKQPTGSIGGQMVSPFASSITGVGIRNAHVVSEDASTGKLVRGMKPYREADFEDLRDLDVGAVLMFKRPTASTEVSEEGDALAAIGLPATQFVNIEFGWKNFADFAEPCRMTVRGLKLLRSWIASGKTAFLHCTVGEDRTGYLAGLYRLLTEDSSVPTIFEEELCEHGYSAGNPQKPFAGVVNEIDADLTPLFLKMAFKIASGDLTRTTLDESVCDVDPKNDPAFADAQWDAASFRCSMSTRYRL